MERWREHYTYTALRYCANSCCCDTMRRRCWCTSQLRLTVLRYQLGPTTATIEEVAKAIRKLKNGRAAGPDDIHPKLLTCAVGPISSILHALFLKIWSSGLVPAEWRDGVIVSLYKGNSHEIGVQTTVPSITLWTEMHCGRPCSQWVLRHSFYSYSAICTTAPLRGFELMAVSQHRSSRHLGFWQCCVLAPALFCRAIDWILERCVSNFGITVGQSLFTDLDYADDAVLFNADPEWVSLLHNKIRRRSKQNGFADIMVQDKTVKYCVWFCSAFINSQCVEAVDSFLYLGSEITSSSYSSCDMRIRQCTFSVYFVVCFYVFNL